MAPERLAEPGTQHRIARALDAVRRGQHPAAPVRDAVLASWLRSRQHGIRTAMRHAPVVLDADALARARDDAEWLGAAHRAVQQRSAGFDYDGHVVALFDGHGRFLAGDGDRRALDGLADINFRPGSLWTEAAVGTNGPGTALATGEAVHIVGTEHFCEAWQPWHCAAVPLRDPVDGSVVGVLDVSGAAHKASAHVLQLAHVLAIAVEQALGAMDAHRRLVLVETLADLGARHPHDPVVALDRHGRVIGATRQVPRALHRTGTRGAALHDALARVAREGGERVVRLPIAEDVELEALARPVLDDGRRIGSTLHLVAVADAGALVPPARLAALSARAAAPDTTRPMAALIQPAQGARAPRPLPGTTRFTFDDIVGTSPALREAVRIARAAARNALPVLVLGESGTGKEVVAQSIHAASARAAMPFVAVNCAAIPRELLEAELFGYVGGAFSGARRDGSAGKFEAARGGTIFLDEIGELTPAAQASLLRVLQEGEVTRVGAVQATRIDVRVIAATNRDPAQAIAAGLLREDLFYRLNVLAIELPPLRERHDDLHVLVPTFLDDAARELGTSPMSVGREAMLLLERWAWPGNVRELKNLVRRLVALAQGPLIDTPDLPATMRHGAPPASTARATPPFAPALAGRARPDSWRPAPDHDDALVVTGEHARESLLAAITEAPTMRDAARRLGITRSTLYRRLEALGLRPGRGVR